MKRTSWGRIASSVGLVLLAGSTSVPTAQAAIGDVTTYEDPAVDSPTEIAVGPDGQLWFALQGTPAIARATVDGTISTIELPDGAWASSLVAGADGAVWAALPPTGSFARITPAGVVTEVTDPDGEVVNPTDVTLGPDGNVWFTSFGSDRVGSVTPSGEITTYVDGDDPLEDPVAIVAGPDDQLWVAHGPENLFARLARVTTAGDVTDVPLPGGVERIGELASGPDGNVWFTSPADDRIGRVTPAGAVTMFADGAGGIDQPEGITAGPDGNLWVASSANDRLARVTPDGEIATFTDPAGGVDRPFGITTGPGPVPDVWFTTFDGDGVGRIEPTAVPGAPTLTGAPGDGAVALSWTTPADGGLALTGYLVLRDGVLIAEPEPGTTTLLDSGLVNGASHEYVVQAVNARGTSSSSNVVAATPRTVPGAPIGLSAVDGVAPNTIDLQWAAPASDGGAALTRYRIYRDGVLVHTTAAASPRTWSDPGRTNRRVHRYEVAAVNLVGTGQRSGAVHAAAEYDCPTSSPAFEDVSTSHPFHGDVCWMDEEGISTGYADGTFRPSDRVSRAAMAAFMFRLADADPFDPPGAPTFTDVRVSHPFFTEVEWMADERITTGNPDGTYRPAAPVSRGAMSAFLYRLAGRPLTVTPPTPTFTDVGPTHAFYAEVEWMAATNISTGYADGSYRPADAVSRQSMSAFLHRLADGPGVNV